MSPLKRVLLIGFDPAVVDYSKWPGLTPEKLRANLENDRVHLNEVGYSAELCLIDLGATATEKVTGTLRATTFDCVLIGAGVRTSQEHFLLFEKVLNTVHAEAPGAKLCFNTNPTDSAAALQRWI